MHSTVFPKKVQHYPSLTISGQDVVASQSSRKGDGEEKVKHTKQFRVNMCMQVKITSSSLNRFPFLASTLSTGLSALQLCCASLSSP